jgi:hypothetical protein
MVERLAQRATFLSLGFLLSGVRQMTFFWHFLAKELVVVDDPSESHLVQVG